MVFFLVFVRTAMSELACKGGEEGHLACGHEHRDARGSRDITRGPEPTDMDKDGMAHNVVCVVDFLTLSRGVALEARARLEEGHWRSRTVCERPTLAQTFAPCKCTPKGVVNQV